MDKRHWRATISIGILQLGLASLSLAGPGDPIPLDPLPLPATETVKLDSHPPSRRLGDLVVRPDNGNVIYWANHGMGVLESQDGGLTWHEKNIGLPTTAVTRLAMDPTNFDHLVVGFGGNAQVDPPYASFDGGLRWEPTVVCERENGTENLRQMGTTDYLAFDPHVHQRLYYGIESEVLAFGDPVGGGYINACVYVKDDHRYSCGAFYRSCDGGDTYDHNPLCAAMDRPMCAVGTPDPVNGPAGNDSNLLVLDPFSQTIFVGDGVHGSGSYALMTSRDEGTSFTWEDVVDTRNSFVAPSNQGVFSLLPWAVTTSPTESPARFASVSGNRCTDGKAHPIPGSCPTTTGYSSMIVRWSGDMSTTGDCLDTNDCDGSAAQDRVWKPIFERLPGEPARFQAPESLLVDPETSSRIFYAGPYTDGLSAVVMLTQGAQNQPWNGTVLFTFPGSNVRLIQDPTATNRFYAVMNSSLHRFSTNDGWQTWSHETLLDVLWDIHVYDLIGMNPDPDQPIVAATENGVQLGDDLGQLTSAPNTPVGSNLTISAIAVDPADPSHALVKLNSGVTTTIDAFHLWRTVDDSRRRRDVMCTNMFHSMALDPGNPTALYAATGAGIWRNPDARAHTNALDLDCISEAWEPFARTPQGLTDEYTWTFAFDPADAGNHTMLAGTRSGKIFQTTDSGASWTQAPLDWPDILAGINDVNRFVFFGGKAFAATSGGVAVRPTPSDSWTASFMGDRIDALKAGASGVRRLYAAGQNGLYRTTDLGHSWEQLPIALTPPHSTVLESMSRDGRHFLLVPESIGGVNRVATTMTAHAGDTWTQMHLEWMEPEPTPYVRYLLYYGTDPDLLDGTEAAEGPSPIELDPGAIKASLTDLDFQSQKWYVALRGVDGLGQRGPLGLPLALLYGYDFSPRVSADVPVDCPARIVLSWDAVPDAVAYNIYRAGVNRADAFTFLASVDGSQILQPSAGVACELGGGAESLGQLTYTDYDAYHAWYYKVTSVFKTPKAHETTGGNVVSAYGGCDE